MRAPAPRRPRSPAAWAWATPLALLLAPPGGPGPALAQEPGPSGRAIGAGAPGTAAPLPAADTTIAVELGELRGAPSVRLRAPDGTAVRVEAVDGAVRSSLGDRAERLAMPAAPAGQGWEIGERLYAGALLFDLAPGGGLDATNLVRLEDYVAGVVAAELSLWSALPAELEAQAVAARTYALATLEARGGPRHARLVDGVLDQAYRGRYRPGSGDGARRVAERLERAVEATRGRVLVQEGRLLDARFHAACGGRGARLLDVFPDAQPFAYPPAACAPCVVIGARERAAAPGGAYREQVAWRAVLGAEDLARAGRALGLGEALLALEPARVDAGERWLEVRARGRAAQKLVAFGALRAALGHAVVPSARVLAATPPPGHEIRGLLVLEGLGRGHGVGLCQVGAREHARAGWTAERILRDYYPSAEIARLP